MTKKILLSLLIVFALASGTQAQDVKKSREGLSQRVAGFELVPYERTTLSLRTNLLYWVGAMPNIGVEWMPTNSIGLLVNGGWAPWSSSNWNNSWGGWFVSPEVRIYPGKSKRWFAGLNFIAGDYNLKLGTKGYQGDVMAGGLTGGYKMPLSNCFSLEFSLGVGYGKLVYDTYRRENGERINTALNVTKRSVVPTQAGVTLIWKIK